MHIEKGQQKYENNIIAVKKPKAKVTFVSVLFFLIIVDLVLGGAGRLISIGPITIRYFLFGIAIAYSLINIASGKRVKSKFTSGFLIYIILLFLSTLIGFLRYPFGDVFTHMKGNLYIFMFIPFTLYIKTTEDVKKILRLIKNCSIILSLVTIAVFLIAYTNKSLYDPINNFLLENELGNLSIISGGLVRVFFKTVPFVACAAISVLYQMVTQKQVTTKLCLEFIILCVGCVLSFTMGLWIALVVGVLICLLFHLKRKELKWRVKTIMPLFSLVLVVIAIPVILEVLLSRFSADDLSVTIKLDQIGYMLKEWLIHPIFGNGFGITRNFEVAVNGVIYLREMILIEMVWFDILSSMGIAGLIGSLMFFFQPCFSALRLYKKATVVDSGIIMTMCASIVVLTVVSAFNPFVVNPIGLGMVLIANASINVYVRKYNDSKKVIGKESRYIALYED